jgi:hypothetical protein
VDDLEQFSEKLKRSIEGYVDQPHVSAIRSDSFDYMGIVISPMFEGMDEGERQAIVWGRVLDTFPIEERKRIEFIYTDAPSEV